MIRKIFFILERQEKIKAIRLILLMLLVAILEALALSAIGPAVSSLSQAPEKLELPFYFLFILEFFNVSDDIDLTIFLFISLAFIFFIKNSYATLVTWLQYSFVYKCRAALSKRIFSYFLFQKLSFHRERNSADLVNSLVNDTNVFGSHALNPILSIFIELSVAMSIFTLLIYINPYSLLFVSFSAIFIFLLYKVFLARRIEAWGDARQELEGKRVKSIQQGLGGIKEILLSNSQEFFLNDYSDPNSKVAMVMAKHGTIQALPRIVFETLGVFLLSTFVMVSYFSGAIVDSVIPLVAVYLAAAVRLLPSISRLTGAIQNLQFAQPVVEKFYTELSNDIDTELLFDDKKCTKINLNETIKISDISFKYSSQNKLLFNKFNETIKKGESLGIIGPSGSGKSSLINMVLGLEEPDEGRIFVDGIDIKENLAGWQNNIGYVPQEVFLLDDTLVNNVAFGEGKVNLDLFERAIQSSQLTDFVDSLPFKENTNIGERGSNISGGQKQRIGIARALYKNPSLLIFDESTSALDLQTESELVKEMESLKGHTTMIIVAHRLSALASCDRIIDLDSI